MPMKHRAECQDCPTTTDPDYGHEVKKAVDCVDFDNAKEWADIHVENTGHTVILSLVESMEINVEYINPDIWDMLTRRTT